MAAHPAPPLAVSESEAEALRAITRAGTSEQRMAMRARIVLRAAEGAAIVSVAAELGVAIMTVKLWRRRYKEPASRASPTRPAPAGPGPTDPTGSSAPRRDPHAARGHDPLERPRARQADGHERRPPSTGSGASGGLKPHRTETFKFSTDPASRPRSATSSGLYLDPPDGRSCCRVDEKTQIQALDRTQPMLPMRPGQVERHTHDYKRNGTTCLFAALEVGTGQVTTEPAPATPAPTSWPSCSRLARAYPEGELHVVLDNVSTHKTPDVRAWLGRHPRITFHFTPDLARPG